MAEAVTHEHNATPLIPFTILHAVFDRKSAKTRSRRVSALPKRAPAEQQFDLMPISSSVKVSHT